MFGQDDRLWLSPDTDPTPPVQRPRALQVGAGVIERIFVRIPLRGAVGIATLRRVRTGSFAPWWWRGKGSRDS